MDYIPLHFALFFIALACFLSLRRRRNLPPGPFPLPIFGNMLQISNKPHLSFAQLSKKYGPLMSIHFGSLLNVIVSSPEMAKLVFQKHGQAFSGRTVLQAVHAYDHDKFSMGFLPVAASIWRDMRKICKEQMFSVASMEASKEARQQTLRDLLDHVQKCCDSGRAVDIRETAFTTTLNIMSATLFSTQAAEFDSKVTQEFREAIDGVMSIMSLTNYADYFPILKTLDPQGIKRKAEICFKKLLCNIEGHMNERMESRRKNPDAPKKNDFLEALVDSIEAKEYQFTSDHLMHLMLDLFVGGSEASSTTIEWIMSELVLNPDKTAKLKEELKRVLGDKKVVEESDITKLPYLSAVIKEVLRYHPPGPLLVPRRAECDQEVNGYLIPKGTQLLFNVWAMARDPTIWNNPDSFQPERFLDQSIDFKGHDFELIPFGSGRRICPGMPLANRVLHTATATLVHNFDWKLEQGMSKEDHNNEIFGLTLGRAVPLRIIPVAS